MKAERLETQRAGMLTEWAQVIAANAHSGVLAGKSVLVTRWERLQGPRVGGIRLLVGGLETGRLLRALTRDDLAAIRMLCPWEFQGEPQCYLDNRWIRIEAGWSDDLAESIIPLSSLNRRPQHANQWAVGKSERGETIWAQLRDDTPHWLTAGMSGAGKSVATQNAVLQLTAYAGNETILIDGKYGESLRALDRLPGVVAPVAVTVDDARRALAWAVAQMRERYERLAQGEASTHRLLVVYDEFQEGAQDDLVVDLLRRLAAQGRSAGVSLLLSTQHPTINSFGDPSTRRNLGGKLALRVTDPEASKVAVGSNEPRADKLLFAGDTYVVTPGKTAYRAQGAYVDKGDIKAALDKANGRADQWRFAQWPEVDTADLGQDLPATTGNGSRSWHYTGEELGVSVAAAVENEGRPLLIRRLEQAGIGRPGSVKASRLLELGRGAFAWLAENGYTFCVERALTTV